MKCSHLLNDLRNFNKIFRKNVLYDNIKNHKGTALPSLEKKVLEKPKPGGVKLILPQRF